MKRIIFTILFNFLLIPVFTETPSFLQKFSQNFLSQTIYENINSKNTPWWGLHAIKLDNEFFFFMLDFLKPIKFSINDIFLDQNKFLRIKYKTSDLILIMGGDVIVYDIPPDFGIMFPTHLKEFPPKESKDAEPYHFKQYWQWDDGIVNIQVSSSLVEQTRNGVVSYDESQLRNTFFGLYDSSLNFNSFKRAWAEGVSGSGIGEKLEIEFSMKTDHVMILNGYVNLKRMDLYTANNRIKQAKIISQNPRFEMIYTFEDFVHFSEITFPEKTQKITIVIEEVYKGTKFDDTCITAIFLKQSEGFYCPSPFGLHPQGSASYIKKIADIKSELQKRGFIKK